MWESNNAQLDRLRAVSVTVWSFSECILVKAVSTEDPEDDFFVDAVKEPTPLVVPTISSGTDPWTVDVLLNDCRIEFQIDTGANVSVISEEQCRT